MRIAWIVKEPMFQLGTFAQLRAAFRSDPDTSRSHAVFVQVVLCL